MRCTTQVCTDACGQVASIASGVWLGDGGEGASSWATVLTEIRNRGVNDVIFVCCDGLKGLP